MPKVIALKIARSTGLSALARVATSSSLRILGYHGIWTTPGHAYGDCTFIAPEQFEARMARLRKSGRHVLPLREAVERLAANDLPDSAVVITIDDGWASTFTHMLPVLEAHDLPATLYAATWYSKNALPVVNVTVGYLLAAAGRPTDARPAIVARIEALPIDQRVPALRALGAELGIDEAWLEQRQFHNMTSQELDQAHRRGFDIQLHTHRHIDVTSRITELSQEIDDNRAFLQQAIGKARLDHFCFPSGGRHPDAAKILARIGVRSATLIEQGINPPGSDPYALRRLLDGRNITDEVFDAYLCGSLHYIDLIQRLPSRVLSFLSRR